MASMAFSILVKGIGCSYFSGALDGEQSFDVLGEDVDLEVHGSPGCLGPSVVTARVCGMTATSNVLGRVVERRRR